MSTELLIHPGEVFAPGDYFLSKITQNAGVIAVDGVIKAPTFIDTARGLANFDHHHGHRLVAPSSAKQLLMNMRMGGLDGIFARSRTLLLANDCDQDVGLCAAIAGMYEAVRYQATSPQQVRLDRFTDLASNLDMTAGAYPCDPTSRLVQELTWVFRPFTQSGARARQDVTEYAAIIREMGERLGRHLGRRGEHVTLDTRHRLYPGGDVHNWSIIRELGPEGRMGAFAAGVRAYVIARELANNRWQYTFGRTSPDMVAFDIIGLYKHFNQLENCPSQDCYGGSNDLGGSPRIAGSGLAPAQLRNEINLHLAGRCGC